MASEIFEKPVTLACVDCGKVHPPRAVLTPSPFQSIIINGILPTSLETAAIRDFVQDTDAEVSWRERTIDRLLCEGANLRRRSEQHKVVIAPIRRVPSEVLAEIFLQLAAVEEKGDPLSSRHYELFFAKEYMIVPVLHRAPLIFGEISREWRDIALSTPRLWNSISLECREENTRTNISLCDMWLKRSGSLPLSIRLCYERMYDPEIISQKTIDDCQNLMKTILPYAQRWRFLDLDNLPASYEILRDLLPESVPILEIISVNHDKEPKAAQFTPWAGLQIAPKLRCLYLDSIGGANITTQAEWSTFPWPQLTHIDVGGCSAYDCLAILGQALTAVACRFIVTKSSSMDHPPISHSGLETLKIEVYDALYQLWSCLTCSVLSILLIISENPSPHFFDGLPSFITRSGGTITNFTLRGSSLNDDQLMSCLADMPLLRHLSVSEWGDDNQFTDRVWECLSWPMANDSLPPLIPNLESLTVAGLQQSSHKSVVHMLKSRVQTVAGAADLSLLKKMTLSVWRDMSQSAYEKLMAFEKLGLKI
ncbi:hypothetical protein B0H19DRAFT_1032495, partial [Mycena capillaripes]